MTLLAAAHTTGHGGHGAGPLTLILLACIALAGYAVSLYLWPFRPCPRCGGERVNRGSTGRRFGLCTRCAGTGRTRRIGATAIHRFYWSLVGDQLRERRRDKARQAQHDTGHPGL